MNAKDIISLARDIKTTWNTNDPYKIAERLGIVVLPRDNCTKGFTAQTIKVPGYPTIISINDAYTEFSKKVLCAHELGHALLHEDCLNHFAITSKNVATKVEKEANLFAIALLSDYDIDTQLSVPLANMNNYLLKSIMDYNIQLNVKE
ncbi:MAG: ImmA/IrrE family metallo-endopeptidase [Roseburia sp.]|nr:ImmA/IrrE family metallo-endopeptidase [Roseburia sp.]